MIPYQFANGLREAGAAEEPPSDALMVDHSQFGIDPAGRLVNQVPDVVKQRRGNCLGISARVPRQLTAL